MNDDERQIRYFLKGHPAQFVSARVIARRVGGKQRCLDDPQWANPILASMLEKGRLEADAQGRYRLRRLDPTDHSHRTFVSPQVRRILEQSSRDFSKVIHLDSEEDDLNWVRPDD